MDVDIDIAPGVNVEQLLPSAIRASVLSGDKLNKHPVGVYLQNMPVDHVTGLAAIPYDRAERLGYTKMDMLRLHVLSVFKDKAQVRDFASQDPDWDLLKEPDVVKQLFHVAEHYDLLQQINPRSIEELADCLALIRPGKRHLLQQYIRNRSAVRSLLYQSDSKGYAYKKGQAIAYAHNIVLQMNIIKHSINISALDNTFDW